MVGGLGGVQVVVQQPVGGLIAVLGGIVVGGEGVSVDAEQVVQPVAARCGFVDQVVGVQDV
ncbi:hypothetical protein [Herbidospora mongoliensis]|uniref:hypothetical protein n=1 Tax=Herbidospora mongoliensis TaxID=688067 RepID=UPI0012FB9867|nr:hypothetical protein [Herbidospora mongoliensis]